MLDTRELNAEVVVVLAVFQPNEGFLAAQIASLAAQTRRIDRVVVTVADLMSENLVHRLRQEPGLNVTIVTPPEPTGSCRSFEIGLEAALEIASENAVFLLCDQDDVWFPDKVARSLEALWDESIVMAHGDAEVIDAAGDRIVRSLRRLEHRKRRAGLRDLLLRNTVTGMTMIMRREVVEAALPFPRQAALYFHHDLWLALVAGILGRTRYLPSPIVQYRQHDGNVVGTAKAADRAPRFGSRAWREHWGGKYAVASYLAKSLYLRATELVERGKGRPERARLAQLSPYLATKAKGLALLGDAARLASTGYLSLARDSVMFAAVQAARLGWAAKSVLSEGLLSTLADFDRRLFSLVPGAQPGSIPDYEEEAPEVWSSEQFEDRRTVRRFDVRFSRNETPRAVIFVPTLNPPEIFAGIATALDIGVGLAERGHDVLFVATDLPIGSVERSRKFIVSRGAGQGAWTNRISLACGVRDGEVALKSNDRLFATAWWTAYLARDLLSDFPFSNRQFHYLIQDYEPGFYAWGGEYALAQASYQFDFIPIFNSSTLSAHFRANGLVPANGPDLTFHPSINLDRYNRVTRRMNAVRRLAVYGRPKVARNLFDVCVTSLEKFLQEEDIAPWQIELISVGQAHPDVVFSGGHLLRSLGKIPWEDYPEFLGSVDIGLSLMLSPHPSHPPLEMAAAGARVVTNDYGEKHLGTLTTAIRSVVPSVDAVSTALGAAWRDGSVSARDRQVRMTDLGRPLSDIVDELSLDFRNETVALDRVG